jgi:hypothetical protein
LVLLDERNVGARTASTTKPKSAHSGVYWFSLPHVAKSACIYLAFDPGIPLVGMSGDFF